jgi:LacI family transcriptional regulator
VARNPSRRPAVTIADVARQAGVSTATAGRVLGGYGAASPEARRQVERAADDLGYQVNNLARAMITGTTHTVGLVIADIAEPFFSTVARSFSDVARAKGYEVILTNTDEDLEREQAAIRVLGERQVDGIAVAPASGSDAVHLRRLAELGMPIVLLDRAADGAGFDTVMIDNMAAAEEAVRQLIGLGHRRIAVVGAFPRGDERSATALEPAPGGGGYGDRVIGYRAAMAAAGLEVDPRWVRASAQLHQAGARAATAELLRLPADVRPTAIFATDASMSLGVLEAILDGGLTWPRDVSVIGFDDAEWTRVVRPELSVVAQPARHLGERAAARLLERVQNGSSAPETTTLEARIIPRGSVGPPPAGA